MAKYYRNKENIIFDTVVVLLVVLVLVVCLVPFIYILSASLSGPKPLTNGEVFLWPKDITLNAYIKIIQYPNFLHAYGYTIFYTVAGTAICMVMTCLMAFPLAHSKLRGHGIFMKLVIVTMFFSGGMIPGYIVVANILNLKNTYWSVLLPGAISAYNMMIVKNFFQGIPQELEDSAAIDGCNDLGILWKIVLPLSLPVLATFGLFYAVGHWNSYFGAMIYMSGARDKWPLQVLLREIIILSNASAGDMAAMDPEFVQPPEQSIKMAVIVVSTVPIMCVYPFLQKYFVKGVMVGALKG